MEIKLIGPKLKSYIVSFYRIPCRLNRVKSIFCILVLLFLILLFKLLKTVESYGKCSFSDVEKAVSIVCDKYQNREVLGNLCADLCELYTLRPNACFSDHFGKDVVFQAYYFDDPVVVKSSKLNIEEFDQIYYTNSDGNRIHPTVTEFFFRISNKIQSELNINISTEKSLEVLSKLWTRDLKNFPRLPLSYQNAAMSNIWYLTQQTEYLIMKYYEDVGVFPTILGTCGPMYVVEYMQPLDNYFSLFYPSWKEDFSKRAKLALNLLNFLEETEINFPLLHFCDVKVGHFGLNAQGEVKLLDMDMVFFEPALIKDIVATQGCQKNEDCNFDDCKAVCDVKTHKCLAKLTDNNFLRICRNILSGKLIQTFFGLLSSPPTSIKKKLQPLLDKCSQDLDNKTTHIVGNELKQLLKSIIQAQKYSERNFN